MQPLYARKIFDKRERDAANCLKPSPTVVAIVAAIVAVACLKPSATVVAIVAAIVAATCAQQ